MTDKPSDYFKGTWFLIAGYFCVYEVFHISILLELSDLSIMISVLIGTPKHVCITLL